MSPFDNHPSPKKEKYSARHQLFRSFSIIMIASSTLVNCAEDNLSQAKPSKQTIRILSLDGAGIDAVSQASFLEQLEKNTGKSVTETFHMVGATSLSGFLSMALTTPLNSTFGWKPKISADDFVEIFKTEGHKIYRKNLPSLTANLEPTYDTRSYQKMAGRFFGKAKIDDSIIDTVVITQNLDNGAPKVFKSWDTSERFLSSDIALASSAAPYHFDSCCILPTSNSTVRGGYLALVDAKTILKNPTAYLLSEAQKRYPGCNYEIVSIGSVMNAKTDNFTKEELSWKEIGDQAMMTHKYLIRLYPESYTRWVAVTHNPYSREDDGHINNINYRELAVQNMIEDRKDDFQRLVEKLSQPRDLVLPS